MTPFKTFEEEELDKMTFPPQEIKPSLLDQLQAARGFTQEKESGLRADIEKAAPGAATSFLASFGAGLAGNSQAGALQALNRNQDSAKERLNEYLASKRNVLSEASQERQLQKSDRDEKSQTEDDDPNSEASEAARQAAAKALNVPVERFAGISATKLKETSPLFAKTIEAERNRRQQSDLQKSKDLAAGENKSAKRNVGQDAVDRDFAKDYNLWTSGGKNKAKNEIQKLIGAVKSLESGETTTGGLTGAFSDRITSNDVLKVRAAVQSSIMSSLRHILGAAFTAEEGKRVINNTWNEADSTQNNIDRIKILIDDLEGQSAAKDQKVGFFKESGTLQGYKMPDATDKKTVAKKLFSKSRNQTKIVYSDGTEEVLDGER